MNKRTHSVMMLIPLLVGMLTVAFNIQPVEASGTIYIRADGSVDPDTAPISSADNITYTFNGTINDSIVVERDNIIIDGNGYTLHGTGTGSGFDLSFVSGVTVKNTHITNFRYGTFVSYEAYIPYSGESPTPTGAMPVSNIIANNTMTRCSMSAVFIFMWDPTWTTHGHRIIGNTLRNNAYGVALEGNTRSNNVYHNNFLDNTHQAHDGTGQKNWWNNDYPSGGNYWSDYNGTDFHSGSHQNETGRDGIGDTPYTIAGNTQDYYPLMSPSLPLFGDLNGDGVVDVSDIARAARAYGSYLGHERWDHMADVNDDGVVDISDLVQIAIHFGQT